MSHPIAIANSDWHLDKQTWIRYPEIQGDSYFALQQVIDLCVRHSLPLIAAGDLFDKTQPDARSVYECSLQIDRMEKSELSVYFTQGQHEMSPDVPWLSAYGWPTHIHGKTVWIDKTAVTLTGLDYTKPAYLSEALSKINKCANIFACHQVWGNFMGTIVQTDARLEDIPISNALIITGDYHKHLTIKVKSNLVASPGSMCLRSIDEPADKAVFMVFDDLTVKSIPIKSRRVYSFNILNEQDLNQLVGSINKSDALELQSGVPDNIAKNIVSVRLAPDLPDAFQAISDAINNKAHLFIKSLPRKQAPNIVISVSDPDEVPRLGLEGNLVKFCDYDSLTYKIAKRLLNSENQIELLKDLQNEFLIEGKLYEQD